MDTITDDAVEAARLAYVELKQQQERQAAEKRNAERIEREANTHSLELKPVAGHYGDFAGTYTLDGFRIQVQASVKSAYSKSGKVKARIYVDGEKDVDFTEAYAMQKANGYSAKGTHPEEDKLFAKLNREVVINKKDILFLALQTSDELAAILGDADAHFSRTAGCSCGCSPAFIASHRLETEVGGAVLNVTSIFISKEVTA